MSKALKNSNLSQRSSVRSLLAISLTLSLATFACTTDRTLGNGDPVTTPGVRTSPTGGGSIGSESTSSGQSSLQSMTSSSSSRFDALPVVTRRGRLTHDQAAAIMAQYQSAPRVRVLGPAVPGEPGRPYASDNIATGQYLTAAPNATPAPVVIGSDADIFGGGIATAGDVGLGGTNAGGVAIGTAGTTGTATTGVTGTAVTAGATAAGSVTGVTAPATITAGATAAPVVVATPVSPTASAAATLPVGAFAARTGGFTPTAAAAITPSVTAASNFGRTLPTVATNAGTSGLTVGGTAINGTANGTTATGTTVTGATNIAANATTNTITNTTTGAAITAARRTNGTAGNVRIVTDANGRRTVTNQ